MLSIKDFMEVVDYKITEGSDYLWDCYGQEAYSLDSWDGDQDGHSIGIVFDKKTHIVYQMEAHDYRNSRAYRWINPDFREQHDEESRNKLGQDYLNAWDDVRFVELETEEDILGKARAIVLNQDYDTRVSIPVDLSKNELFELMIRAHERDITLNEYMEEILKQQIELLETK